MRLRPLERRFLSPRTAASPASSTALPCKGIVGDGQFHGLQPLDLVAQPPGGFEFEIAGGLAHLLFEVGDMGAHDCGR